MRRAAILLALAVLAPACVFAERADASVSQFAVPTAIPDGWFVLGARAAIPREQGGGVPYYATGVADGPAVSFGGMSCDGGCDVLTGKTRLVRSFRNSTARLIRNGKWVWVTWSSAENNDNGYFVAARGLSDREALAAARGARIKNETITGISARSLPRGVRELGTFDVARWGIPFGAERVSLIRGDGAATMEMYSYRGNGAARAAQRFWSDQSSLLSRPPPSSTGLGTLNERAVLVESAGRVVVVVSAESDETARTVARSMRDVDAQQWQQFRGRVSQIPPRVLLSGFESLPAPVLFDGTSGNVRWATVLSTSDGHTDVFSAFVDPDSGSVQRTAGARLAPESDLSSHPICGTTSPAGPSDPAVGGLATAVLAVGVVPVAAKRVQFSTPGNPATDGTLGEQGPDESHRYVAALVPTPNAPAFLVAAAAYDESGTELVRTSQFGHLYCPSA